MQLSPGPAILLEPERAALLVFAYSAAPEATEALVKEARPKPLTVRI